MRRHGDLLREFASITALFTNAVNRRKSAQEGPGEAEGAAMLDRGPGRLDVRDFRNHRSSAMTRAWLKRELGP